MKTTMQKYEIIDLKLKGWSNKKIHDNFGVSRDTVKKYWNEYQTNLCLLLQNDPNVDIRSVIENLIKEPSYNVSNRTSRKYNEEIDALLDKILEDEKTKTKVLGPNHKQALTNVQIYELIKAEGYDIGLTTIQNKIKEKRNIKKEVYIKQEYEYGQRFEYDFGEVALIIDGKHTKCFLAVMSCPASGFRWAYLYRNSKMEVFIDSQVKFFEMLGGCFKEGVYDNMRNVVSKFIGRNEKQLNKQLINLALYYGFTINVTNCFSGNEKGTVEEAVKVIRNRTFAVKYEFDSFTQAQDYLQEKLKVLNSNTTIEEEKKCLTAYRAPYESAVITTLSVDKYSFIRVDNNFYSVPEDLAEKHVIVKIYPNDIEVFYKQEKVATHNRLAGKNKTCIDIMHYLNTFLSKPGALKNSAALNSIPELKDIFNLYYKDNPKQFIELLSANKDLDIKQLIEALKPINNSKKLSQEDNLIEQEVIKQLLNINDLFTGGNKYVH